MLDTIVESFYSRRLRSALRKLPAGATASAICDGFIEAQHSLWAYYNDSVITLLAAVMVERAADKHEEMFAILSKLEQLALPANHDWTTAREPAYGIRRLIGAIMRELCRRDDPAYDDVIIGSLFSNKRGLEEVVEERFHRMAFDTTLADSTWYRVLAYAITARKQKYSASEDSGFQYLDSGFHRLVIDALRTLPKDWWPRIAVAVKRALDIGVACGRSIDLEFVYKIISFCAELKCAEILPILNVFGSMCGPAFADDLTENVYPDSPFADAGISYRADYLTGLPWAWDIYFHVAARLGMYDLITDHFVASSPCARNAEEVLDPTCSNPRGGGLYGERLAVFGLAGHPWHAGAGQAAPNQLEGMMSAGARWRSAEEQRERDAIWEPKVQKCQTRLQELDRDRQPLEWAKYQEDLGRCLWKLGKLGEALAAFESAIAAFQTAGASDDSDGQWCRARRDDCRRALAQLRAPPVIGFLNLYSLDLQADEVIAFGKGLGNSDYIEDYNVAIEYRWAAGQDELLPQLAADLVRRQVAVIAATGGIRCILAAKGATSIIPIVFSTRVNPVKPVWWCGVSTRSLIEMQLRLLREVIPEAQVIAALSNQNDPKEGDLSSLQAWA